MPSPTTRQWIVFAATSLAFLAAHAESPPIARLGNAVVPTQYRIELAIDPSREAFSGNAVIDVTLNDARDAIWLHGRNLQVSEVFVTDKDARRIDARYEERDDSGENESACHVATSVDQSPERNSRTLG